MNDNSKNTEWRVGQVKFFDNDKGFGFLECWDDGQDYFVHISEVDTKPIDDHVHVVFKLKPSRKKHGTHEAQNVSLVSQFKKDPLFLQMQYFKYDVEYFRRNVLQGLSNNNKINLLEKEVTAYQVIRSEDQFVEFKKTIQLFTSFESKGALKDRVAPIISTWIEKIATDHFKVKFWLDGILTHVPDIHTLYSYVQKAGSKERLTIFNTIDYSYKKELIQQFILDNKPQDTLEFILEHLKQINEFDIHTDVKSKLFDNNYWEGKTDWSLYGGALEIMRETLDDGQLLTLFLNGYMNTINSEYVITTCCEIPREEIEKIIERHVLSVIEAESVIDKLLEKEINHFLSRESSHNQELINSDFNSDIVKYDGNRSEPFKWISKTSKQLSESYHAKVEAVIIDELPEWVQVDLWENGYISRIPIMSIANHLLDCENIQSLTKKWIARNNVSTDVLIDTLKSNIQSLGKVATRKEYYVLSNHILAIVNIDPKVAGIEEIVPAKNLWFAKLALWLNELSIEFSFDEYKDKLVFLSPDHQIRFLKKLFWLGHTEMFDLTVEKLKQLTRIDFDIYSLNQRYHPDAPLDISVDIVIEAIKSLVEKEKFLFSSELLAIVLKDLTFNKKHRFKIRGFFEECLGRKEAKYNWKSNGVVKKNYFNNNQFYFVIEFPPGEYDYKGGLGRYVPNKKFESLKEAVKKLPGRKWNPQEKHWGVPARYEHQVMEFARENRFFVDAEGSNFANNIHLAEFIRTEKPNGITFCEGRLAKKKNLMFDREFWWCCNQPCFENCEIDHLDPNFRQRIQRDELDLLWETSESSNPEEKQVWEFYTLLDFLNILGLNTDDSNRVGDYIEKGKYYQFISTINQFNRLLDRLYCEECSHFLFPVEDSHFAHHRVVRFHCENTACAQHQSEVYLHHCLNGKCNNVIDSRKSKKCPNGLFICSNINCGCCCSHDMMHRRLQNLEATDGLIHEKLREAVDKKLGHLERAEHYCYQCAEFMNEVREDVFHCHSCRIEYDVTHNKFKRPYRHLGQNQSNPRST